jgi:hypothetical protein
MGTQGKGRQWYLICVRYVFLGYFFAMEIEVGRCFRIEVALCITDPNSLLSL